MRLAASTSARARIARSDSACQFTLWSSVASGITPLRTPATYAVETWSRCGAGLFASAASYRRTAPTRLVRNPSSIGGSNATVAAQWITTSRPPGISSPSAEKSPSTTSTRSSSAAAIPSVPTLSRRALNVGRPISDSTRWRPLEPSCGRTSSVIRVSGKSSRRRSNTAWPRKPVTPVTNTFLPASLRTIELARVPAFGRFRGAAGLSTTWQIMPYLPNGRQARPTFLAVSEAPP